MIAQDKLSLDSGSATFQPLCIAEILINQPLMSNQTSLQESSFAAHNIKSRQTITMYQRLLPYKTD